MTKTISRKKNKKDRIIVPPLTHRPPPGWRILTPDLIHIIVGLLRDDKPTLRACSLAAREFSRAALSHVGRHITVNYVRRIKQCAALLSTNLAFQHVRSLDLGVTSKSSNPEDYLKEQFTILGIFAQRQTLTRLWLSKIPFSTFDPDQRGEIRNIVVALSSTVNDLGLYECRFISRVDMISFISTFCHCDSLYIRDCVADSGGSAGNMFSGLPKHKLSLDALELTSTLPDRSSTNAPPTIDVSSLIEDAALDVSRLSTLICDIWSTKQARSVAVTTSVSPVQHFQLGCAEPGGFHAFFNPLARTWSLESLTIKPLTHSTDFAFWRDGFHNFPSLPHLKELIIICHYPGSKAFDFGFWRCLDDLLDRTGVLPLSVEVDIRTTFRSVRPRRDWLRWLLTPLIFRTRSQVIKFWGDRE